MHTLNRAETMSASARTTFSPTPEAVWIDARLNNAAGMITNWAAHLLNLRQG